MSFQRINIPSTTPASPTMSSQPINIPSSSPILSYFLAQSPTKTPGTAATTFPFKRKFGNVDEEEIPVAAHARRASATVAHRFSSQSPTVPLLDAHTERGTNVLRRLSLSNAFVKPSIDPATRVVSPPSPPPNTAVSPTCKTAPFTVKPHRSATISVDGGKPRRAPSPMGERILKGHFDGFN
jgi:septal ring-binding cell division protein DamX